MKEIAIGVKPIRQRDERSLAEAIRITGFTFALATPFFVFMGVSAGHVEQEYRLSRFVEQRRQLQRDRERLLLTRDALLSPDTIRSVAVEKLGMVEESPQEFMVGVAPEEKRAGEPGSRGAGEKIDQEKANGLTTPEASIKTPPARAPAHKAKAAKHKDKGRVKR